MKANYQMLWLAFFTFYCDKINKPLDPHLAQKALPVAFPLVTDPLAKFRVPSAGGGNFAVAVIGPELGQLVELVCPAFGM